MTPSDFSVDPDTGELDPLLQAVASAPPRPPPPSSEDPRQRLGTLLRGKYRLDAVLGVGGMAVVYKATHARNEKEFAIKMLLREHSSNDDIRRRFGHEGRYANKVQHPGAVSIIDDDVSEDGVAFLVLELLHGVPCDELCSRCGERLPLEAGCAVALQTLDVLRAAHDKGIIHRDIKPGNLFVLRDGAVKVLDFGIACLREGVTNGSRATKTGIHFGTPAFMAPEQAVGGGRDVDKSADIWGVGATLFTLLSGMNITRPARSLAEIAPEMPRAVVDVVDRALQFDPAHRWRSAVAMRDALAAASPLALGEGAARAVLASLLSSAGLPSRVEPAANHAGPSTRHSGQPEAREARTRLPSLSIWIGGGATLLAGGVAGTWLLAPPEHPPPSPPKEHAPLPRESSEEVPPYVPIPTNEARPSVVAPRVPGTPRSCAEARTVAGDSDRFVRIDPDGTGPIRPFEVYCAGMADGPGSASPREYLALAHGEATGEPGANTTRYVWGGLCDCPDLVLRFARVRLDPRAMSVDPSDTTFATYNRARDCEARDRNHCGERAELAWGRPGSCRAPDDMSGSASIDLRGTPFALASTVRFVAAGFGASGQATVSKDRKTASLVGGGQCGSMVPEEPTIALVQAR